MNGGTGVNLANLVCLLLCVAGSVNFAWSIPVYYPTTFLLADPSSLTHRMPVEGSRVVFENGVVFGSVAKSGELSSFRHQQKRILLS